MSNNAEWMYWVYTSKYPDGSYEMKRFWGSKAHLIGYLSQNRQVLINLEEITRDTYEILEKIL